MNWAKEIAEEIVKTYPDEKVYTIASGVSPSGFIHIGNFREIVTPYMVVLELRKLGKNVRFILSVDNFDRFRKVPGGLPESLSQYIGKPYVDFPCPLNEKVSYGKFMQERFIGELKSVGIEPECIFQADMYRSGKYTDQVIESMHKRKQIFEIIDTFRTQDATEEEVKNYYPISLYCSHCGKDSTTITSYDEKTEDLTYTCACGHSEKVNLKTFHNVKLQWKVDWPMRWKYENVLFESGGLDHSTAGSSHDVAKEVVTKIFNWHPPIYYGYNFIGIKGGGAKMSSSKGGVLTLTDLLNVYDKNIILWFYAKYKPNQAFNISLDNDVIRYYSEFDRWVKAYFEGTIDEGNKEFIELCGVTKDYLDNPSFSNLATFLPIVNFNEDLLAKLMAKEGVDTKSKLYKERLARAKYWVTNYGEEYQVNVLKEQNVEFYKTLNDEEKGWIKKTIELMKENYETTTDLQNTLYAVVKTPDLNPEDLKKVQKRYFEILYNLLLGESRGPKLGLFLTALGKETVTKLLSIAK